MNIYTPIAMASETPSTQKNPNSSNNQETSCYIVLQGDITRSLAHSFYGIASKAVAIGIKEFNIIISSNGGDVDTSISMYHFIRGMPMKIITYNISSVESAAVIVYLAGDERIMVPGARFMIHPSVESFNGGAAFNLNEARDLENELDVFQKIMESVYRERTQLSQQVIEYSRSRKIFIYSDDALKFGIASKIMEFRVPKNADIASVQPG